MGIWDKITTRPFAPIWRHSSMLLAAESVAVSTPMPDADGPYRAAADPVARERRVTALVYSGQRELPGGHVFVVRRVELDAEGRLRVVWEHGAPEPSVLVPGRYGRLEDVVVFPGELGGVIAVDLATGSVRWSYPHPAPPASFGAPDPDTIIVEFLDGIRVHFDRPTGEPIARAFAGAPPPGRPLLDVRGLDDAPVAEQLSWIDLDDGVDALATIDPGTGRAIPVLEVDTGPAVCRFDGCYAVDSLLVVRVLVTAPGATVGMRRSFLCDPKTWRPLGQMPGSDGNSSELFSPRWSGRL